MPKNNILIITGTGGSLGTGHLQRMLALAVHLNKTGDFTAKIFLKQNLFPPDESFQNLLTDSISENTDFIIRDMRDSSVDEILLLKKAARVLAIDDSGQGNSVSDYTISLLPAPSDTHKPVKPETSMFLYGYNFSKGIKTLAGKKISGRNIDVAVYIGHDPSQELVAEIKKAIPISTNSILLTGKEPVVLTGDVALTGTCYAEILCRTKIMVTHFGLTMFEAHVCGCGIVALNPTAYHSTLTEMMKDKFQIFYSAEHNSFSHVRLHDSIRDVLNFSAYKKVSIINILNIINKYKDNFTLYLKTIAE